MFCNFLFIQTVLLDRDDNNGDDAFFLHCLSMLEIHL